MIQLSMRADFTRMERSLMRLAGEQVPFAAAQAINDTARAARDRVNAEMPSIFDRPNPFTRRAVVAPRELAATPAKLSGTVTLQPIQAKYLLHEEIGGTRSPAENTMKPAQALLMPRAGQPLDQFGGIPRATVAKLKRKLEIATRSKTAHDNARKRRLRKRIRSVAKRDRGVFYVGQDHARLAGGFWQRLPGHKIQQLLGFARTAHYEPRFGFHQRVELVVKARWPEAMATRLHDAIATSR